MILQLDILSDIQMHPISHPPQLIIDTGYINMKLSNLIDALWNICIGWYLFSYLSLDIIPYMCVSPTCRHDN